MPANKNRCMLEKQVAENNGQELCNRIKLHFSLFGWIRLGFKVCFGSFFHDGPYGVIWSTMVAIDEAYTIGTDF